MKYERCPNCKGRLKIPERKRGQPVECPVCHLEFTPPLRTESTKQASPRNDTTAKPKKPSLRALPVPVAISKSSSSVPSDPSTIESAPTADPMTPPVKQRSNPLSPPSDRDPPDSQPPQSEPVGGTTSDVEAPLAETVKESSDAAQSTGSSSPAVAKIIKTEFVQPLLNKEGNLPTLQLKDAAKPKKTDGDYKSNPAFLALIICASLVSSGLMLFFVTMETSTSKNAINEARKDIRQFYEVRVDEELAPFQRELRQAQLAHSRGDYKAETRYYQRVMARFRAEDRSEFKGLTGSPTWDVELQELVSILLNDAKKRSKRAR
jgi:hypothetical protein